MDSANGPVSGGWKAVIGPQSGVFSSTLGGGTASIPFGSALHLTYLPVADDVFIRVRCEGPLSLRGKPLGFDPLREYLGPKAYSHTVLLSLEKVTGAETSGVSWLYQAGEKFSANGGKLILYSVPSAVLSLLEMLQLELPFKIVSTEAAARVAALLAVPAV